jgi:cytochrome c oxidase assembly protein subunit 15
MGDRCSGLLFEAKAAPQTPVQHNRHNPQLFWFSLAVAVCSLGLIGMGGLVTSHGVGMSVPDWPTSYGYNMFALPVSTWLTGGVFHEHTHRLWASLAGVLVVALTRWLGGCPARRPLAIVGGIELVAGIVLPLLGPDWRGAGYFLSGIGGVVLLAGLVWFRNPAAARPLGALGWWVFWMVQVQGLLGGLRVVLDSHVFAGTKLGVVFGIIHGCLGQIFLVLLCVIVLLTSRRWSDGGEKLREWKTQAPKLLLVSTVGLIFAQLVIGATMRHQHAGLAIWDFPLAHGAWWPDLSDAAIAKYNAQRVEVAADNPVTGFQILLQMVHRAVALTIAVMVFSCFWLIRSRTHQNHLLRFVTRFWLGLIVVQIGLGAWTIWSDKAADIATLHVMTGALALVTGTLACVIAFRDDRSTALEEEEPTTPG